MGRGLVVVAKSGLDPRTVWYFSSYFFSRDCQARHCTHAPQFLPFTREVSTGHRPRAATVGSGTQFQVQGPSNVTSGGGQ